MRFSKPRDRQRVWRHKGIQGILVCIIMRSDYETLQATFTLGAGRYIASPLKEAKASGFVNSAKQKPRDTFVRAIRELSAEDEELPLPNDQGPIVFKDGVFQIDVSNAGSPAAIDPALKGLIDSILGS